MCNEDNGRIFPTLGFMASDSISVCKSFEVTSSREWHFLCIVFYLRLNVLDYPFNFLSTPLCIIIFTIVPSVILEMMIILIHIIGVFLALRFQFIDLNLFGRIDDTETNNYNMRGLPLAGAFIFFFRIAIF